jgi:hypothetical protein
LEVAILHQRWSDALAGETEAGDNIVVVVKAPVDFFFELQVFGRHLGCGIVLLSKGIIRADHTVLQKGV